MNPYLLDLQNNYELVDQCQGKLGEGGFGCVEKIRKKETNEFYAAKTAKVGTADIPLKEIQALVQVRHPCCLRFIGYSYCDFAGNDNLVIVTEYLKNGSVGDIIENVTKSNAPPFWDVTEIQIVLLGISIGIEYLHKNGIIHRDLKPFNVLLDDNNYPVICDFGLARNTSEGESFVETQVGGGTVAYLPPEVIDNDKKYSKKSDIFAFAVVMYEIIEGKFINKGKNIFQFQMDVLKGKRQETKFIQNDQLRNLIEKCWAQDPDDRPTIQEVVECLKDPDYFLPGVEEVKIEDYIDYVNAKYKKEKSLILKEYRKQQINIIKTDSDHHFKECANDSDSAPQNDRDESSSSEKKKKKNKAKRAPLSRVHSNDQILNENKSLKDSYLVQNKSNRNNLSKSQVFLPNDFSSQPNPYSNISQTQTIPPNQMNQPYMQNSQTMTNQYMNQPTIPNPQAYQPYMPNYNPQFQPGMNCIPPPQSVYQPQYQPQSIGNNYLPPNMNTFNQPQQFQPQFQQQQFRQLQQTQPIPNYYNYQQAQNPMMQGCFNNINNNQQQMMMSVQNQFPLVEPSVGSSSSGANITNRKTNPDGPNFVLDVVNFMKNDDKTPVILHDKTYRKMESCFSDQAFKFEFNFFVNKIKSSIGIKTKIRKGMKIFHNEETKLGDFMPNASPYNVLTPNLPIKASSAGNTFKVSVKVLENGEVCSYFKIYFRLKKAF